MEVVEEMWSEIASCSYMPRQSNKNIVDKEYCSYCYYLHQEPTCLSHHWSCFQCYGTTLLFTLLIFKYWRPHCRRYRAVFLCKAVASLKCEGTLLCWICFSTHNQKFLGCLVSTEKILAWFQMKICWAMNFIMWTLFNHWFSWSSMYIHPFLDQGCSLLSLFWDSFDLLYCFSMHASSCVLLLCNFIQLCFL